MHEYGADFGTGTFRRPPRCGRLHDNKVQYSLQYVIRTNLYIRFDM